VLGRDELSAEDDPFTLPDGRQAPQSCCCFQWGPRLVPGLSPIRIHTRADWNKGKEGVSNPEVITWCYIPARVHVEPAKQRILITLLCRLEAQPEERRLLVEPDPRITVEFLRSGESAVEREMPSC